MKLALRQTQRVVMTPLLQQAIQLLQLSTLELEQVVRKELEENPLLEEVPVEATDAQGAATPGPAEAAADAPPAEPVSKETATVDAERTEELPFDLSAAMFDEPDERTPVSMEEREELPFENLGGNDAISLTDHLMEQLRFSVSDPEMLRVGEAIIGNLDEDGYLRAELSEIAAGTGSAPETVEAALQLVQAFDPPGVAARDLRECLMLQLHSLGEDDCFSMDIVRDHLAKVQSKQYKEIAKAMGLQLEEIMEAIEIVKALDPRPGQKYNRAAAPTIEPDVYIVKVGGEYKVVANEDEVPQLRLSATYRQLLERDTLNKEVKNYVKDRFRDAVQLLKNLEQRKHIIVKVCESVVRRQADFLDRGIDSLKPMMIKDVAEEIGVHPSTVSRAVANKFAHTAQGVFELRYFFSEAVNGPKGTDTSLLIVKRKVKKYVETEDPRAPLTDEKIALLLQENDGIKVNRRSITKYREDMRIPSTHQRRRRD